MPPPAMPTGPRPRRSSILPDRRPPSHSIKTSSSSAFWFARGPYGAHAGVALRQRFLGQLIETAHGVGAIGLASRRVVHGARRRNGHRRRGEDGTGALLLQTAQQAVGPGALLSIGGLDLAGQQVAPDVFQRVGGGVARLDLAQALGLDAPAQRREANR